MLTDNLRIVGMVMKTLFSVLRVIAVVIFGLSTLNFWGSIAEASSPPENYIVWDRMPAEAPVQMELQAANDVKLYVRPNSNVIVGELTTGVSAERISVAVFTHPASYPVRVLQQMQTYKNQYSQKADGAVLYPGDIIYLVMYTGEGTYLGWYEGKLLWWLPGGISNLGRNGQVDSPWAQYIGKVTDPALSVNTWYCLRKTDGTVGWTQVQFAGQWKKLFK